MKKACKCGKVSTEEALPLYCDECKTYTHPVYVPAFIGRK